MGESFEKSRLRARRQDRSRCVEHRTARCGEPHAPVTTLRGRTGVVSLLVLVLPAEVEVPAAAPDDGSGPRVAIDLLGGGGTFAIIPRDCQGQQIGPPVGVPYREGEGALRIEDGVWRVGVRLGNVRGDDLSGPGTTWLNPHVALAWKHVGLGAGPFIGAADLPSSDPFGASGGAIPAPFSGHLWLGERHANVCVSIMESAPLLSGGGYYRLGLRLSPRNRFALFAGVSAGPYESDGFFANLDLPVHERVTLLTRARLGSAGGEPETGLALGLRWSVPVTPSPPRDNARTSSSRSRARTPPRR